MNANVQMGFAKIAFSYGLKVLYYLAEGKLDQIDSSLFYEWIRWVISRAGDTDTNAAISGGLIGSVTGFWKLPERHVVRTLKAVIGEEK